MHSATGAGGLGSRNLSLCFRITDGWLDSIGADNMNAGLTLSIETQILPRRCRVMCFSERFKLQRKVHRRDSSTTSSPRQSCKPSENKRKNLCPTWEWRERLKLTTLTAVTVVNSKSWNPRITAVKLPLSLLSYRKYGSVSGSNIETSAAYFVSSWYWTQNKSTVALPNLKCDIISPNTGRRNAILPTLEESYPVDDVMLVNKTAARVREKERIKNGT
ncbi:hypothetical protein TNIN_106111 [Trichonephila inaurata madagascariensis]|uniref:Uncharacterized protein n=1 Tax=Trichonephila inaurata madagascariensis TaxID=2747483 RepID=A0A8X7BQU2_9ARAC|nr:hypothetical protein TNIN_106111 [Trichonephila inaurata madagascariensis]